MLDRTKAIFNKTIQDLRVFSYFLGVFTQVFYLGFLIYSSVVKTGALRIVNITLALLTFSYLLFLLCITKWGKDIEASKRSKKIKSALNWCKRLAKVYTLGVMIYGIYTATNDARPVAVLLCAAMVALFVFQCIFDLLSFIIGRRFAMMMTALEADMEPITKPARSVGNFFKKITGKEVEPKKELTEQDIKHREILDGLVAKEKENKRQKIKIYKAKTLEEKERKKRRKAEMKESKRQLLAQQKQAQPTIQKNKKTLYLEEVSEETALTTIDKKTNA